VQCRQPTEITVDVTNEACGDLGVVAGAPTGIPSGTVAQATTCEGTVVLVPSGDQGARVSIRAVAALGGSDVATCLAGGTPDRCIVARRVVSFLPHQGPHLPIALRLDCAGVACGDNETCVHHACFPSTTAGACLDLERCLDAGPPPLPADGGQADAGPDAGAVAEVVVANEPGLNAIDVRNGEIAFSARSPDRVRRQKIGGSPGPAVAHTFVPLAVRLDDTGALWFGGDEPASPGLQRLTASGVSTLIMSVHPAGLATGTGGVWYVDRSQGAVGFFPTAAGTPLATETSAPFDIASNGAVACWTDQVLSSPGVLWTRDTSPLPMSGIGDVGTPEAIAMNSTLCVWSNAGTRKISTLVPAAGSHARQLADVTDGVVSLDATDSAAYWLNANEGVVYKIALNVDQATPQPILRVDETGHGKLRQALAHDAAYLYVIAYKAEQVVRIPL
jgi:hypothetical protein